MCSVATARRLGVPEEKWVYQHSGAHCHEGTEQWHVTHRPDMSKLPGMTSAIEHCFDAADRQLPDRYAKLAPFYTLNLKTTILPRQALDKHRESTQKRRFVSGR